MYPGEEYSAVEPFPWTLSFELHVTRKYKQNLVWFLISYKIINTTYDQYIVV